MKDEIIIYQPDEQSVRLEVRIEEDTVWLTQAQMAELFQTTRNNITLHISNIFKGIDYQKTTFTKGEYEDCSFINCDFSNTDLSEFVFAE